MPAQFSNFGISFQYPENWTLDENDALAGNRSVTVFSPGGAFWSVAVHPRTTSPTELAEAAVTAMKEEYEGVEVEQAQEQVAGVQLDGYDLNFFCLDLTNTAAVRCFRGEDSSYSIFWQAEDHEFEIVRRVFLAMTTSLLTNLERPQPGGTK